MRRDWARGLGEGGPLDNAENALYLRMQDNQLAAEVLGHLQAPQVAGRLKALFEEVEAAYAKKNPNGNGDQEV